MTTTAKQQDGPDRVRGVGLAVVFAAAAILSFDTLNRLASDVGYHQSWRITDDFTAHLSWLLPVGIDGYAWLTIREWLLGRGGKKRSAFAARSARIALGLTMAANAVYHLAGAIHWNLANNPVVAMLIGAVPAFLAERAVVMFTVGRFQEADEKPHGEVDAEALELCERVRREARAVRSRLVGSAPAIASTAGRRPLVVAHRLVPVAGSSAPAQLPAAPEVPPVPEPEVPPVPTPEVDAGSPTPARTGSSGKRKQATSARPARKYPEPRRRRTAEETRKLATDLQARKPTATQAEIAKEIGISDRQLRNVLAGGA